MTIPVGGTPDFMEVYNLLPKDGQLYKTITAIIDSISENPRMGESIEWSLIPEIFKQSIPDLTNMLRVKVTKDWRLLYTLRGYPNHKKVHIVFVGDHKKYDKLFGY